MHLQDFGLDVGQLGGVLLDNFRPDCCPVNPKSLLRHRIYGGYKRLAGRLLPRGLQHHKFRIGPQHLQLHKHQRPELQLLHHQLRPLLQHHLRLHQHLNLEPQNPNLQLPRHLLRPGSKPVL